MFSVLINLLIIRWLLITLFMFREKKTRVIIVLLKLIKIEIVYKLNKQINFNNTRLNQN